MQRDVYFRTENLKKWQPLVEQSPMEHLPQHPKLHTHKNAMHDRLEQSKVGWSSRTLAQVAGPAVARLSTQTFWLFCLFVSHVSNIKITCQAKMPPVPCFSIPGIKEPASTRPTSRPRLRSPAPESWSNGCTSACSTGTSAASMLPSSRLWCSVLVWILKDTCIRTVHCIALYALQCTALRCLALRCLALRCVALPWVALCYVTYRFVHARTHTQWLTDACMYIDRQTDRQTDGRTDGRLDGRTDRQIIRERERDR